MPHAYEYLTDEQKNNISGIFFKTSDDNIKLQLMMISSSGPIVHNIHYNKFRRFVTTVKNGNEDLPRIDLNFVDAFLENLEMLLKYQKSVLAEIRLSCRHGTVKDCERICDQLERIFKLRTLSVERFLIDGTTVAQAMSFVQHADKSKLIEVLLINVVDRENFENIRNELSEVKMGNDGRLISFKFADPTVQSISPEEVVSSLNESLARNVFEKPPPMQFILKHLHFFDIERLRKVNRGIRECITLIKPNPKFETYSIILDPMFGLHIYNKLESGELKDYEYFSAGNEARIFRVNPFPGKENIITIPGEDFKAMFLHDMENNLSFQTGCMEELFICYQSITADYKPFKRLIDRLDAPGLYRRIGDILKRRERPLKTRKFSMGSESQIEMMEILPAIDTNQLRTIELLFPSKQNSLQYEHVAEFSFEVDQLSLTAQWKNAEQLISNYLTITTPIPDMNILHFVNLEILVKTISSEDVFNLKTNLLKSSKFRKFKISFRESTIVGSLIPLFGEPYLNSDVKKIWYFQCEDTSYYMHFVLKTSVQSDKAKSITLTRVAIEESSF